MGVGLLAMATRFAQGKQHDAADAEARIASALAALDHQREMLLPMIERDGAAFGHVTDAYRLPKSTDAEVEVRDRAIQKALLGAMAVPEEALCLIRDALVGFASVADLIGRNIVSDVGAGTRLLEAAAEMSRLNVLINVGYLRDRELARVACERVESVCEEIRAAARRNHDLVKALMG